MRQVGQRELGREDSRGSAQPLRLGTIAIESAPCIHLPRPRRSPTVGRVTDDPESPPAGEAADEFDFQDPDFVPPDPDEPPPVELWNAFGDVLPWGTLGMLLAWGTVFAWMATRHELDDRSALLARGASVTQLDALDASWRLLASTFLHSGTSHLFFNALTMLVFGPAVERIFTRWGFWIACAYGGAGASLASLWWRLSHQGVGLNLSVGASGAIFALGGTLLTGAFRLRRRLAVGRARAFAAAVLFLALPALAAGFQRHGTDNAAHAGGLLGGLLVGAIVPLSTRVGGEPPGAIVRTLGAVAVLALALSFVRVLHG